MSIKSARSRPDIVPGNTLDAVLVERFRTAILGGKLSPGTKLSEEVLAEASHVTRARIRGVLQLLAFEELVELRRNRGAFIASPGVKEARDVFDARRVIERATTEIVTRTILTPQLRTLSEKIAAEEVAWLGTDLYRATHALGEFHLSLCSLAHNTALTVAVERLIRRTSLILGLYGLPHRMRDIPARHRELLVLIERGESLAASRAMEHCLSDLQRSLDLREQRVSTHDLKMLLNTIG